MAMLRLLRGQANEREFPLDADRVTLGRERTSDIFLRPTDVSRTHVEFLREDERYYAIDRNSRNRTYLNSQRMLPNVRYLLRHDDLIKICNYLFVFVNPESPSWRDLRGTGLREMVDVVDDTSSGEDSGVSSLLESSPTSWEQRASINAELKLRALMRISSDLYGAFGLEEILEKVLDNLLRLFPEAECGLVVFGEENGRRPFPNVVRYRDPRSAERIAVSRTIINKVLETQQAVVYVDLTDREGTEESESIVLSGLKSLMCAPLLDLDGKSLGVVQLDTRTHPHRFTEADLDLLSLVVRLLSFAIEESRMQNVLIEQRAWQREMEVAREIQLALLPGESPRIAGYDFFDFYAPAKVVGGDYYDYVRLSEDRLAIVIGDVSGKGVPAAMLMAQLSSELRVHLTNGLSPVEVLERTNRSYGERAPEGSFVTLALLILDTRTHEVEIANAGHMRPFLVRAGQQATELADDVSGCPVGLLPEPVYRSCRQSLQPGDFLVLYSDGVTDATNAAEDLFGAERLQQLLSQPHSSATELGETLIQEVEQFVAGEPQLDDMCLVCLGRTG